jgi:hypothetical protein
LPRLVISFPPHYRRAITSICRALPLMCSAIASLAAGQLRAYTTESPEVRAMVERGVEFLRYSNVDPRLGGRCIVGLVLLKQNLDDHELVKQAIVACEEACARSPDKIDEDIYSIGLAIVFLCELDARSYRNQIKQLVRTLQLRQKDGGGWGYPLDTLNGKTGDTSMTQYAVLGLWTAAQHGVPVPPSVFVDVTNWLLRTQDPGGGWGYQGNDPGPGDFRRKPQTQIRHSLCAAALGCLYICHDVLGLSARGATAEPGSGDLNPLPPALKPVGAATRLDSKPAREATRVEMRRWQQAVREGRAWFEKNSYMPPRAWPNYYLYALERYQSFRELVEDREETDWYDVGVDYLARNQRRDGSWLGQGGAEVSTAFALLCLTRGTRQAIRGSDYGEGRLTGGRGLPRSVANVRLKKGRIVSATLGVTVEEALAALEDPASEAYASVTELDEDLRLSPEPNERSQQLDRLRRLVKSGSYKARATAVRLLSEERDLDDVPLIVDALADPDAAVRQQADWALRRISRRLDGVEMPGVTSADRKLAWLRWYRSIRPFEPSD